MSPGDEMASSAHKLGEQLRASLDFQRPSPQPKTAGDMHEVLVGIGRHLNSATAALETIYSRLEAIEHQTKRRGVGSFTGYLLAACVGVGGFLAWQSYGEAAKQIIATKAPELGWSPNAKQMIAGWVQELGWSKPPAITESTDRPSVAQTPQPAPVVQTASAVPSAPVAPSIDPEQVHQIASDVAALRQTVEQLAAGQGRMAHVVDSLQGAVAEILVKTPEPPPPPPVAAAVPAPKPKPKPMAPPWSRGPMPPYGSPYGPPYQ
jgi:hypothetical protein